MEVLDFSNIEEIEAILSRNGLLAFPTETVFGLGISSKEEDNYQVLMNIKGREQSKALPLMVSSIDQIYELCTVNDRNKAILMEYLPGPFTFILPLKEEKFPYLSKRSIAIRMSEDIQILNMINKHGYPMWVSSANMSNEKTGVEFEEVKETFQDKIDGIVKGKCIEKIPTSIYDICGDEIICVRQGKGEINYEISNGI